MQKKKKKKNWKRNPKSAFVHAFYLILIQFSTVFTIFDKYVRYEIMKNNRYTHNLFATIRFPSLP